MSDDLLKRLSRIGERVSIPCPDNIRGCLVFHYRVDTDPACVEAIDEIERLRAENERLREALEPLARLWLYPDDLGFEPALDIRSDVDWDDDANDMQHQDCFVLRRDIRSARTALGEENK